jgi:hypothetical protein
MAQVKLYRFITQIEVSTKHAQWIGSKTTYAVFPRQPGWRRKRLRWKDSSSHADPLAVEQSCSEVLQPLGIHSYVVVDKCKHLTQRIRDSRIEGIRFAWLRLKKVAKSSRIAVREASNNVTGLVRRVVVYDQDLPGNGAR